MLVNLGTPDATDKKSMRRYLKQFLSDKRVVEAPRLLWWIILNGIILNTRPKKSGEAYDKVWIKDDEDGSPLRIIKLTILLFHVKICRGDAFAHVERHH